MPAGVYVCIYIYILNLWDHCGVLELILNGYSKNNGQDKVCLSKTNFYPWGVGRGSLERMQASRSAICRICYLIFEKPVQVSFRRLLG